jgi:hypothetical protein
VSFVLIVASVIAGQRLSAVASEKRLEAAVAQSKLKEQEAAQQQEKAAQLEIARQFTTLKQTYRLNLEVLSQIWLLEYVFGPRVLNVEQAEALLWKNRIKVIRGVVDEARRAGRGEQMETLLWEGALAFWLVSDGDFVEAEPLLQRNIAGWSSRLDADDEWLATLQAMAACAAVNRCVAEARDRVGKRPADADSELRSIQAALDQYSDHLDDGHTGTPVHLLVLRATEALHEPSLLNDSKRRDDAANGHAALQEVSPSKPTATRPK